MRPAGRAHAFVREGLAAPAGTNYPGASLPRAHRRALNLFGGLCVAVALAHVAYTGLGSPGGVDAASWLGDGAIVLAAGLCLWRVVAVAVERTSWLLVGLGLLAWVGSDAYSTLALRASASLPAPSWAELGYLVFYPCAAVALLIQIRHAAARLPHAFILDWAIGGFAAMAGATAFALPELVSTRGGSTIQAVANLAHPIGDLVLFALLVGASQLNSWRLRGVWAMFGLGLIAWMAGDTVYLYQAAHGSWADGRPIDALWTLGALAMGLAAWQPVPTRLGNGRLSVSGPLTVFAVGAVAILVWDHFSRLSVAAVLLAAATLLAATARELWSLAINRRLVAQREREAGTDDQTGLANHRALIAALDRELERSRRYGRRFAVLFIDLDHFKAINDTRGHDAGDRTLREFARVASGALREVDTLGRWGGEEFLALLPETDIAGAPRAAERVRASVAGHAFGSIGGGALECSIGVAVFPTTGQTRDELLRVADAAMYRAKRQGRNRAVVAEPSAAPPPRSGVTAEPAGRIG